MQILLSGHLRKAVASAVFVGVAVFGAAQSGNVITGPGFLPDLQIHLNRANESLKLHDFRAAMAQSEAVLLVEDIKVYLDFSRIKDGKEDEYRRIFNDSARMWTSAIENEVRFVETDQRSDADVVVSFRDSVYGYTGQVGGHATWRRVVQRLDSGDYNVSFKANIAVRTVAPNGRAMNEAQMRHICAHELGHLLGLDDSSHVGDIMGPLNLGRPASNPSETELSSLRNLRNEAREIRRQSIAGWLENLDGYTPLSAIDRGPK